MAFKKIKDLTSNVYPAPLVILLSLLLFLSPILYFSILNNPSHVPRSTLLSLIGITSGFVFLAGLLKNKYDIYIHTVHLLVLALLVLATVSIGWTIDFGNFAYEIIPLWSLVIVFFIASQISSFQNIIIFIIVSVLGATYAALIGLLQNQGLNPIGYRFVSPIISSTFGYKNHAALYLDLIIPIALLLIAVITNKKLRWTLTLFSALIIGYQLETHTRGSWLVLAAWLLFFSVFIFYQRKYQKNVFELLKSRKKEYLFVLIASLSIFAIPGQVDEKWRRTIPEGQFLDNSSQTRLIAYHNSLQLLKENPVTGVGYGAFWKGFREVMNHPEIINRSDETLYFFRLHNDPLQYFLELGIPGGLLVITIFCFIIYMGFRLYTSIISTNEKLIVVALLLGILACGAHSIIDFPLHKPSSSIQFWLYMGLITGIYVKHYSRPINYKKLYVFFPLFILLLYTGVASAFHYKHIKSNYYHRAAVVAKTNNNCKKATSDIEKAIKAGDFYLTTHVTRLLIHAQCKTEITQLLKIINEELHWDDTNTFALLLRGQIMLQADNTDVAYNDFKKITEILPHRPTAKVWLVKTLLAMGQENEARKLLDKIIEQHPDNTQASELLSAFIN